MLSEDVAYQKHQNAEKKRHLSTVSDCVCDVFVLEFPGEVLLLFEPYKLALKDAFLLLSVN